MGWIVAAIIMTLVLVIPALVVARRQRRTSAVSHLPGSRGAPNNAGHGEANHLAGLRHLDPPSAPGQ